MLPLSLSGAVLRSALPYILSALAGASAASYATSWWYDTKIERVNAAADKRVAEAQSKVTAIESAQKSAIAEIEARSRKESESLQASLRAVADAGNARYASYLKQLEQTKSTPCTLSQPGYDLLVELSKGKK